MRKEAENKGFETILLASGADDDAIMSAIQKWIEHTS
jgi:hypothetical protein